MKNVSLLSKEYDQNLATAVQEFGGNVGNGPGVRDRFCLFHPSFGNADRKPQDFIIYGQALNRWPITFDIREFDATALSIKAREESNTIDPGSAQSGPIDWVNQHWGKMSKSFFWQVTYKLVADYHGIDRSKPDWSQHLVWSNLMKIAPAEGGNPNNREWEAHLPWAIKLFEQELIELKPKFAILLTNWAWAKPFVEHLGQGAVVDPKGLIHWDGRYNGTRIIVTKRPPRGKSDLYVKAIIDLIGTEGIL